MRRVNYELFRQVPNTDLLQRPSDWAISGAIGLGMRELRLVRVQEGRDVALARFPAEFLVERGEQVADAQAVMTLKNGGDHVDEAPNDDELNQDESGPKSKRRFLLRYYRSFNAEQCNLPQTVLDQLPKVETYQHDPIEAAEQIIAGMPNPPEIVRAGSQAFYSPITDRVTLPPRELFASPEEEACTVLHEYSHASGSPKRLNRSSIAEAAPFGSPTYSFEELVAEMSAAFLCAEVGISAAVLPNQAAYIQGWLARLRSDKRLVIMAAAQAQKAADFILKRIAL